MAKSKPQLKYQRYQRFREHMIRLLAKEIRPEDVVTPSEPIPSGLGAKALRLQSATSEIVATITLYYTNITKNSDKVYKLHLIRNLLDAPYNYTIEYEHGRRGSTSMRKGKRAEFVSLTVGERMYGEIIAEKKGEGYTENVNGIATINDYVNMQYRAACSWIKPQQEPQAFASGRTSRKTQ